MDGRFTLRRNDPFWRLINNTTIDQGCWNWTAYKNNEGYGRLRAGGEKVLAHRLSYSIFKGEIAEGLFVCHTCDNPACINPEHLFLGTHQDNVSDCVAKGRHKGVLNSPFKKGNRYGRQ